MEDIIKDLLNQKSFEQILKEYELDRYELLDVISTKLYDSKEKPTSKEKEILEDIYRKEACLFQLTNELVMLISDTHMESSYENLNFIKGAFQFCKDHGIHYLIHGGDIADGTYILDGQEKNVDFGEVPLEEAQEQAYHILEKYPHDPSIKQFILGGNHDERYIYSKDKIDLLKLLAQDENIYSLGYNQAFFSIYNQIISLEHFSNRCYIIEEILKLLPHTLKIKGHSHIGMFYQDIIYLPTLSRRRPHSDMNGLPGFIVLQASETKEDMNIALDRYFYIEDTLYEPDRRCVLTRKKK